MDKFCTLRQVYGLIGASRQGCSQQNARDKAWDAQMERLVFACELIRMDHPVLGTRKMHGMLCPGGVGRDRFEAYMLAHGFRVTYKEKFIKTTTPLRFSRCRNLLKGLSINNINRVWVSDITG